MLILITIILSEIWSRQEAYLMDVDDLVKISSKRKDEFTIIEFSKIFQINYVNYSVLKDRVGILLYQNHISVNCLIKK